MTGGSDVDPVEEGDLTSAAVLGCLVPGPLIDEGRCQAAIGGLRARSKIIESTKRLLMCGSRTMTIETAAISRP